MINKSELIFFCDFDGTFAEKDIGHRLFIHFTGGENEPIVESWKRMEISSRECISREAALIDSITYDELYNFLDQFGLREGTIEFYQVLKDHCIPFHILSDGSATYINYILNKNNLSGINIFANKSYIEAGKYIVEFPYDNLDCERCGSCKGARILETLRTYEKRPTVVFIGDGLSDICALPHADLIFARGDLLEYGRRNNYNLVEYKNFYNILDYLKESRII